MTKVGNILLLFLMAFLLGIMSVVIYTHETHERTPYIQKQINVGTHVEHDYEIDLKQDYIIVYSKGGNVDTIPYSMENDCSPLEAFFERDNM